MVVDTRHDHSFRVPRHDLSAQLGTPNACNGCHTEKPAVWTATAIESLWTRTQGLPNQWPAFHAAWTSDLSATTSLTSIASGTHNGPKDPGHEARGVAASIQKH